MTSRNWLEEFYKPNSPEDLLMFKLEKMLAVKEIDHE